MAESILVYAPGATLTGQATAAVVKSTFVAVSGNRIANGGNVAVATATAAGRSFGVAAHDAATGELVTIHRAGTVRVLTAGVLAAFDEVEVGATGKAVKLAAGKAVGYALSGAASGALAEIHLYV
ncbi:DUF2190 family protein [Rhodococcus qingshengii]|uniref:capsid cement protein n=1 Tax=Rhodococcus TaxID=1827 RepID=UPI000F619DF9|nr:MULTISPECIES: capsid cement protein [Rhodococcus]AZI61354.1 DUF2190 domain-containing protein [Rhodococcus sp. NJ-530]BDQ19427.1 DUF2190 family protein [Rhodococcus qingshengii]